MRSMTDEGEAGRVQIGIRGASPQPAVANSREECG